MPNLDHAAGGHRVGNTGARREGAAHLRRLHQDGDGARRRADALIQEEYDAKLQALQDLVSKAKNTTPENLREAGSASLPITRGVVEALRDEPDQHLLSQRLASEVALASVLEKALLLQRTLLTGKKEPNVAANQLAVEAVNHESDTLDREIRNLKTELELRRELANNSPMAIIQRHGTRAAGSRGIYEGDPVPDRLDQLQKGNPGGRP